MTSSSLTKALYLALAFTGLAFLGGCIADTAEDTDLPWSSNNSWEGLAPISPMLDRYD